MRSAVRLEGDNFTLAEFEDRVTPAPGETVIVDLRRLGWMDPFGLVAVACVGDAADRAGREVEFHAPTDPTRANYIARMGLSAHLDRVGIDHGLPSVTHHDVSGRLVELMKFFSERGVEELCRLIYERLEEGGPTQGVAGDLYEAIAELGNNAVEHAGVAYGLMAAQVYERGTPDQRVVFAVGDVGIGIRESLRAGGYEPRNDREALRLALRNDVSTSREAGRGHGLPDTCQLILGLEGRVRIRSGKSALTAYRNRRRPQRVVELPGALAGFEVPCGVPRRSQRW